MNTPRVFITGAGGFVGSHITRALVSAGYCVAAHFGRSGPGNAAAPAGVQSVSGDLGSLDLGEGTTGPIDVLVHCAGRAHRMKETATDALVEYRKVNHDITLRLAERAASRGVRLFVYLSTVKVIGDATDGQVTESTPPNPSDPYALSKAQAEEDLRGLATRAQSTRMLILRLPMVYGPGNKGNVLRLLRLAQRGWKLPLGAVRGKRSMVYAGNVADAVRHAIANPPLTPREHSTYYVTDGADYTSGELYDALFRAMHGRKGTFVLPSAMLRLPALIHPAGRRIVSRLLDPYRFSSAGFRGDYHWSPPCAFEPAIEATVKWYQRTTNR